VTTSLRWPARVNVMSVIKRYSPSAWPAPSIVCTDETLDIRKVIAFLFELGFALRKSLNDLIHRNSGGFLLLAVHIIQVYDRPPEGFNARSRDEHCSEHAVETRLAVF
jgi:hypothetical protein